MKKISAFLIMAFVLVLSLPQEVSANMAAPKGSDVGSSITFEKNDEISVLSEVLDITVHGSKADIVATYKMKNTKNERISTQTMFLSPNMDTSGVKVTENENEVSFNVERYALNYETRILKEDWKYAVLTDHRIASHKEEQTVDTISFFMDFEPNEEYDVVVSYTYQLGGYPDYDTSAKRGEIEYYLTPAAMWKDFSSLTINLYLDRDMPVIKSSSLQFNKVKKRTYQYVSETLPEQNLEIVIDENWYQNLFSTLRSPYLFIILLMVSPIIIMVTAVVVMIVHRIHKKKSLKG